MTNDLERQLSTYLTDVHAIELQALAQVTRARKVAGDAEIEAAFAEHVRETSATSTTSRIVSRPDLGPPLRRRTLPVAWAASASPICL